MIESLALLADLGDFVGFAIFAIVALISVVGQFLNKQREEKAAAEQLAKRRAARAAGQPQPQPPKKAGGLEDEIGEFLRRAAKGRAGQPERPAAPEAGQPAQAGLPPRPVQPRAQAGRPQQRRPAQRPVQAQVVEPQRPPVGEGVKEAVEKDLNTSVFQQRAQSLGEETRQTRQTTEQRLHKKFDHELGSLEAESHKRAKSATKAKEPAAEPLAVPATSAAGFAALLANVDNVRQAVVLNEILQRPEHRW